MTEIERKFLVTSNDFIEESHSSYNIKQGFLNRDPERTVRVRIKRDKGYITVKGKSSDNGLTRFEWEKEIPKSDAEALLQLCENYIIDKTRYEIAIGNHTFEVDVFHGNHNGLILAEVELKSENETYTKPHWLGNEVTGNVKYYNSELSKKI